MNTKNYFKKVAYESTMQIGPSEEPESKVWKSNFDDSYMTHVGMEDDLKHLAAHEITDELTHGVGYSPKDGKWYGWSHRAICGFKIGSTCKRGDCHYVGSTIGDQERAAIDFWLNDDYENVRCTGLLLKGDEQFFKIVWEYKNSTPNKALHGTSGGSDHFITPLGRGEWTAETMADAKQMAKDFNEGVS